METVFYFTNSFSGVNPGLIASTGEPVAVAAAGVYTNQMPNINAK